MASRYAVFDTGMIICAFVWPYTVSMYEQMWGEYMFAQFIVCFWEYVHVYGCDMVQVV